MEHSLDWHYNRRLIAHMEKIANGSLNAAEWLGVGYNGSWAKWKRDPATLPPYMVRSLEAHTVLTEPQRSLIRTYRADKQVPKR